MVIVKRVLSANFTHFIIWVKYKRYKFPPLELDLLDNAKIASGNNFQRCEKFSCWKTPG